MYYIFFFNVKFLYVKCKIENYIKIEGYIKNDDKFQKKVNICYLYIYILEYSILSLINIWRNIFLLWMEYNIYHI